MVLLPVSQHSLQAQRIFANKVHSIWVRGGKRARIGLAISGGVDSMALAKLCHDVTKDGSRLKEQLSAQPGYPTIRASFTAFIVDHKIRGNSSSEARHAANELERLNIEPQILELDWRTYGTPSALKNVETVARKLRYQALGRACYANEIASLLVAHHADDQSETVLSRILGGYTGPGLAGMRDSAPIPECLGIYGVDHSGRLKQNTHTMRGSSRSNERLSIESSGVTIARPLLHFTKDQLIDVCQEGEVRWFEDHTNADRSLTLRNTVRFLQREKVLPTALRRERLSVLAENVQARQEMIEYEAHVAFCHMPLTLDLRLREAEFVVQWSGRALTGDGDTFHAVLLRKMLELVAPTEAISLQGLDQATDFVFRSDERDRQPQVVDQRSVVQIAGVDIRQVSHSKKPGLQGRVFAINRGVPTERERAESAIELLPLSSNGSSSKQPPWSEWYLWDSKYWIRVARPSAYAGELDIFVRFLTEQDVTQLRRSIPRWQVDQLFKVAKGKKRWTLPAIIARQRQTPDGPDSLPETLVALPSLGWSSEGWSRDNGLPDEDCWLWDIRYKHVKLYREGSHKVIP